MAPRVVVGWDIGTSLGWAVLVGGERTESGTARLPSGKGFYRARWVAARDHIEVVMRAALKIADGFADDVLAVYESLKWVGRMPNLAAVYYAIKAFIEEVSCRLGIRCCALLPNQWKEIAVGHGGASKTAYISAASERYGLDLGPDEEDEAAALGVAYAALVELGGPVRLVAGQQETLTL